VEREHVRERQKLVRDKDAGGLLFISVLWAPRPHYSGLIANLTLPSQIPVEQVKFDAYQTRESS